VGTKTLVNASGPCAKRGSTSNTTRYWLACVNNGRNLPLAERTIECVIYIGYAYAEPARRIAIDFKVGLQAAVLEIARHVGELRQLA
jgi:hypothetical protein